MKLVFLATHIRARLSRLLIGWAFRLHFDSAKCATRRHFGVREFLVMRKNAKTRARFFMGYTHRYNPDL